jgi:ribonuclease HI
LVSIDSYLHVELTGVEGIAEVTVYTDGSKIEKHVGAGTVAVKDSREIHTETQGLNNECTVFQAKLCGIRMAIDWIQNQRKKASTYAINVDSKAAILAIVNKLTTHPLAVDTRRKTIELRKDTTVTFHWVRKHSGLKVNERADYLAKTVARYKRITTYDAIPVSMRKAVTGRYYVNICNALYTNSGKSSHTKPLIPSILQSLHNS